MPKFNSDYSTGVPPEVVRAIESPKDALYDPDYTLFIGDNGYEQYLQGFEVEAQTNGAIAMKAIMSDRIPLRLANAPVWLRTLLNNVEVPLLEGRAASPLAKRSTTELWGFSPAAFLDRSPLVYGVHYEGNPADLARSIVGGGHYWPDRIRVGNIGSYVRFTRDDSFEEDQTRRDVLNAIAAQTGAVWRDTPYSGFEGFLPPEGEPSEVICSYEASEGLDKGLDDPGWLIEGRAEELVDSINVFRKGEPDAQPPVQGFSVSARVPYRDLVFRPHWQLVEQVEITDDDPVRGKAQAQRLASQVASRRAREEFFFYFRVPFNPLLRLWSVFRVGEDAWEMGVRRRYEWMCVVSLGLKHSNVDLGTTDIGSTMTEIKGRARLLSVSEVP